MVEHAKYSAAEAPSSTLQSMLSLLISPPPSMQFAEKLGFIEKNSLIVGPFLASHAVAEDAQTVMIFKRRSQHDNERKELATISRRSQ